MKNKKFGILVLVALLSLSNVVLADDTVNFDYSQNEVIEKIKANKDTLAKAQDAMNAKDYQTAITLLTGYINEKPKKYEAYKLRGDAYYALRRYYKAQNDYQSAIDIKSSEDKFMTNTKYVSAIVLGADKNEQLQNAELGDLYGALMYAQKAMNDSAYTTSYENAVKYNSHIYLPQPNKNDVNKINCPQKYGKIINPQGIDIKIYGAIDDIEKGNYNESLYKLQDVTRQYPNYYFGHYLTGVALSELEKDDDAIKSFQKAITLNPYDFESRASLGRIYFSKAETTFSDASARKSVEYFKQALKQNKNCPTYYFYIGMNELQIGNTNVAITNFDKALQINPSDYNSMYYKLIAQYINGNYQDVVDGTSKLLLKHVSNYNSVLYLRALAYTKLNDNDRALQDLNTIENNIGDIYNSDIKTTSAREKSLESYVHYLKAQIQHSKGAGSAEDNAVAYSNPIINRLANAQKAMEPYEKTLQGDSISLSDYNKFESFYSTSLPKLLESGAVITYDDIDNQYDYIRTTFADLGVSFLYLNPDYKMTTIKDYPYKKYSSKLNKQELGSLSVRPESDMANVELAQTQSGTLRKSTPPSELIAQNGQPSLAQLLASQALSDKPKPVEIKKPIVLRDTTTAVSAPKFNPETPDAERIDTSKNIASGEIYESKTPAINKQVTKILDDEKKIQDSVPKNVETSDNGSVKISVQNPVQTPDVVIRNKQEEIPAVSPAQKTVEQTTSDTAEKIVQKTTDTVSALEPMKFHAQETKKTDDFVIKYPKSEPVTTVAQTAQSVSNIADSAVSEASENVKQSAKEAKRLAKEQAKAEKEALALAKKEAKQKLAQEKEALKLAKREEQEVLKQEKEALKLAQKQAEKESKALQKEVQNAQEELAQKTDSMRENVQEISDNSENIIAQTQNNTQKIIEKHANIESDINIKKPSNSLTIDNINDIVELDTTGLDKKLSYESDLFNSDTVFSKPQAQDLTPPVTLPEEPAAVQNLQDNVQKAEQTVQKQTADIQQNANAQVPVVNVPEITVPNLRTAEEQSQPAEQIQPQPEQIAQEVAVIQPAPEVQPQVPDEEYVTEKLSQVLSKMLPEQKSDDVPYYATTPYSDVEMTLNEAEAIKAKRLKLKQEAQYAKEQKKALAKKQKEQEKLQKEQERLTLMAQRDELREQEKAQKQAEKEKIAQIRHDLKQQKVLEQEQEKLEKQQTKVENTQILSSEQTTEQATKSWLNAKIHKSENAVSEVKPEKTAQQIRAEQSRQAKKLEKEMAKQQKVLAQEQKKIVEQNDETKIQRLKAKLTAMRGSMTSEEKKAQKAQVKAERAKARAEYKAKQLAKKSAQSSVTDAEKFAQAQQKAEQKAIAQVKKQAIKEQKAVEKAQKAQAKQEQKLIRQAQKQEQNKQIVRDTVLSEQQKAEQKAIKQALKEQKAYEKAQQKQINAEQKAQRYAQKLAEKEQKAYEKAVNNENSQKESIFSKLKFWKKNNN